MPLHRLTCIILGVPDVAASSEFFTDFGLDDLGPGRFGTRDGGQQLQLEAAPQRVLRSLGVGAEDGDDLLRIASNVDRTGLGKVVSKDDERLVLQEPATGLQVEVTPAERLRAHPRRPFVTNGPGAGVQRYDRPSEAVTRDDPVRPSNLTHVVYGSTDQPLTLAFFTQVLGFEISDEIPGVIAFTRCGEVHHNVAIQAAPVPYAHHIAFELDDVDDVARGGTAMILDHPDRHTWGIGRHAIGSNWFWYLRDPSGTFVEYTADIDRISDQDLYRPKEWGGHEFLYAYGPNAPREFMQPDDLGDLIAAIEGG